MKQQIHGGDVYSQRIRTDFSANINPLGPPESVKRAAAESMEQIQNYPDVNQRQLRQSLAAHEDVPESWLTFGNGAAELIFALCLGCRPKKALLVSPGFAEYETALKAAGCDISWYELREEQDFQLKEDYLEYITPELDMVFLCNPNNPTGILIEPELLAGIAKKCLECNVLFVLDECFNGFLEDPEESSMKRYLEQYPNLFLLKAFTKLYAMPGLRLGYGICSNLQVQEAIQEVLQPWSVSIPAQAAGVAALKEGLYVAVSRKIVKKERSYLQKELQELGLKVWEGAANFLFFKGPEGLGEACRARGYLIRDCSNYRGLSEGYYRIAVRTGEENQAFLQVLKDLVS
jgi:threonine-phosphate decarboxylase